MEELSNKIKELGELKNKYKKRDDIISKKEAEIVKEEQQRLSRIKEDTEPFHQDPVFRGPGNEERYFLLATQGAIRVRVYKGDEITAVKDPEKYNLSILRPLNERFKKFVDVIIKKAREAL